jgi:hypothetical protein
MTHSCTVASFVFDAGFHTYRTRVDGLACLRLPLALRSPCV